ncbi:hypothetical protein V2O64_15195 [Verrucomicrobiaceae bacterium 227]
MPCRSIWAVDFNRNHATSDEGAAFPDEQHAEEEARNIKDILS